MKKILLYTLTASLFIAGCTSKEQDDKIESFWQQQISSLFSRHSGRPAETPPPIPEKLLLDENGKPLFPEEQEAQPAESEKQQEPTALSTKPTEEPAANAPAQQTNTKAALPASKKISIEAVLFTHADSPQTKQLKADHWDQGFLQRYQGRVFLMEYDMKNPASRKPLQAMMRKHKLSSVTVPILFIGDQSFQGYPFGDTDPAVRKALTAAQNKQAAARKRKQQPTQYMEIIMEDTNQTQRTNTKASPRDSRAMQLALASVEKNNQAVLNDMGSLFGEDTKAQAYIIISRTERLLRNKASSSPDYKTYLATQKNLLQLQEKELNELMRQNAKKLRSTRG